MMVGTFTNENKLTSWSIVQVPDGRHKILGVDPNGKGRLSSTIKKVLKDTRIVITESGNQYDLSAGKVAVEDEAEIILGIWCARKGYHITEIELKGEEFFD